MIFIKFYKYIIIVYFKKKAYILEKILKMEYYINICFCFLIYDLLNIL